MVLYLILTAVCLYFTGRAVIGLFRERFPHPNDLAILSTAYYGIPLSLCGYFDWSFNHMAFLAPFAADAGLAEIAMRYICLALAALVFGRYLGARLGSPTITRFAVVNVFAMERVRFSLIGLISLTALGVYLFGVGEFLSGYATEAGSLTGDTGNAVIYATLGFMGLAVGYSLVLSQTGGRPPPRLLILTCLIIALIVLGIRAKRLEILSCFLPAFVVLISRYGSVRSMSWRVIGGVSIVLTLIIVSLVRVSEDFSIEQVTFMVFAEGLYAGHSMPGIIERLQTQTLSYEYGGRYISALVGFVPRFLWEGKDDLVYAGNIALEGVAPQGATNFLAEVVLQGGFLAVALSYVTLGFVFERIWRFHEVWDISLASKLVPARFCAYIIAVAIFVPHFRDGIIPALKLALQGGVFLFLISGMRLFPKSSHAAAISVDDSHSSSDAAVVQR